MEIELGDVNYCNSGEYDLVFSDQFGSQEVNADKWYTYVPPWGSTPLNQCLECRTGNTNSLQIYKDENVTQSGGTCNLTVKDEPSSWLTATTDYSSGYLQSKEKFQYGKIEMTCKLPSATGLYPSFWMFSGSGNGTGDSDEIDIFEFCTENPYTILSNIHGCYGPDNEPINTCNDQHAHNLGFDFTANWFVMGVDWSPYKVDWYIDILDGNGPQIVRTFPRYYTLQMEEVLTCSIPGGTYYENPTLPDMPLHIKANLRVKVCDPTNYTIQENLFPQSFQIKEISVQQSKPCDQTTQFDNLELFQDTEWNSDQYFSNLTLANDVTLTINNSTVSFASIGQLKMRNGSKLILNGSTLTSCEPGLQWTGVNTSQNLKTEIEMNNGSIIENAMIGIHLKDITWGVDKDLMSTLTMDNSTIRNCDVGIKLDFGITTSYISNTSSIEDCGIGIQLHKSEGLIIDNTDFINNDEGIRSIDSYSHVKDGNKFEGGRIGISIEGTMSGKSGMTIGDMGSGFNEFNNQSDYAISSQGSTHPSGVTIVNCKFTNTVFGTTFEGENYYEYFNNTVENSNVGVKSLATGDYFNAVNCNVFDNIDAVDNVYFFENSSSQFLQNSSIGTHNVNHGLLAADITDHNGDPSNPAGNCFSVGAKDIVTGKFNSDSVEVFTYHYNDSDICEEPINTGNYISLKSFEAENNCNGMIGVFNLIDPDGDGVTGFVPSIVNTNDFTTHIVKGEVINKINTAINNVILIGGDNPRTDVVETPYPQAIHPQSTAIFNAEVVLDQWIRYAILRGHHDDDYDFVHNILNPLNKWKWKKMLIGSHIRKGDYTAASNILNAITSTETGRVYYRDVQEINIKRLIGPVNNNWIDQNDLDLLEVVAHSKYPAAGYARSLYRLLIGIQLPYIIPDASMFDDKSTPRNKIAAEEQNKLVISPNPATNAINISNNITLVNVTLYDIYGNLVYSKVINDRNYMLNVKNLSSGLYFLSVVDENNTMNTQRIIIN